jgi:hypothetical protein
VAVVLVTGMSGVGKSTVLTELGRHGHTVVDTDYGDYIDVSRPDSEPLWREDHMVALLQTASARPPSSGRRSSGTSQRSNHCCADERRWRSTCAHRWRTSCRRC